MMRNTFPLKGLLSKLPFIKAQGPKLESHTPILLLFVLSSILKRIIRFSPHVNEFKKTGFPICYSYEWICILKN